MNRTQFGVSAALAAMVFSSTVALAADPDPKKGKQDYYGTGRTERAPEFADVQVTFSIGCQKNASDVISAISKERDRYWKTISSKTEKALQADAKSTEVNRSLWNEINIQKGERAQVQGVNLYGYNRRGSGIPTAATEAPKNIVAKRIDSCTGKEVGLEEKFDAVYSGSQTIGIRTADLGFAEGLVRDIQKLNQGDRRTTLQISSSGANYDVTDETKRLMANEVLKLAREEATGKGSRFESDVKDLRFANAFYKGHRLANAPVYQPAIGSSYKPGESPIATLEVPFVFTIYAESTDKVNTMNSAAQPLQSVYSVKTQASAPADYLVSSVSVEAKCHKSAADAVKAEGALSQAILADIGELYKGVKSSETDGFVNNEPSGGFRDNSVYTPVEFDAQGTPQKYLDRCENKLVDGCTYEELPAYYTASRSFNLRSSNFEKLYTFVQDTRKEYGVEKKAVEGSVSISNATGAVVQATTEKLQRATRKAAAACVQDPNGQLAQDAAAHGFTCAYLKDLRQGELVVETDRMNLESAKGRAAAFDAAPAMAPGGGPMESEELPVTQVVKDGETRPKLYVVRNFVFTYEILTENYIKPAATKPVVTPEGPNPLP